MGPQATALESLRETWLAAWPEALAAWSKFTRLRMPSLCLTEDEAREEGLTGSFAAIRLTDQRIMVSLPQVRSLGIEGHAVPVLAHEIGHHVYAPATLTDHARMLARMRRGLPTLEAHAPMVANLYTDLLINDRLQRSAGLDMAGVYEHMRTDEGGAVWALYMRIYEILWSRQRGSLHGGTTDARLDGDAWLGARLVRSYARDWLKGSGRFAALLLPHLLEDQKSGKIIAAWFDTSGAGAGGYPDGLVDEDPDERDGAIHPALDPALNGEMETGEGEGATEPAASEATAPARGQARQPFELGEILRAMGIKLTDHEVAVRYYKERAAPHLIRFPVRKLPESVDPMPEGLEGWDFGEPLDAVDWLQSVLRSPRVVPGLTTVQRVWGTAEGKEPRKEPLDLDLYVDSSGSMPNPQHTVSFLTLAGAIVCLSALRAGARVHAVLWSGKNQVKRTDGFVRDEDEILRVLTGFYGDGTAFPIPTLRKTWEAREPGARPAHILVISDDGISTMFDKDERGNSGWDVAAMALERARGGGTLVLNLPEQWETYAKQHATYGSIARARDQQGWHVHRVASWEDLMHFAKQFSQLRYGPG